MAWDLARAREAAFQYTRDVYRHGRSLSDEEWTWTAGIRTAAYLASDTVEGTRRRILELRDLVHFNSHTFRHGLVKGLEVMEDACGEHREPYPLPPATPDPGP